MRRLRPRPSTCRLRPTRPATSPSAPVELSHVVANTRPQLVKMVANGADGNVRGQMVEPGEGAGSDAIPGGDHFLTFKGRDTR